MIGLLLLLFVLDQIKLSIVINIIFIRLRVSCLLRLRSKSPTVQYSFPRQEDRHTDGQADRQTDRQNGNILGK